MYTDTRKTTIIRGERAEIKRHQDNLKVEGKTFPIFCFGTYL